VLVVALTLCVAVLLTGQQRAAPVHATATAAAASASAPRAHSMPPASPQQNCSIDTSESPLARACVRLTDVCLDGTTLILYGSEYQQVGLHRPAPMPSLTPIQHVYGFPWRDWGPMPAAEVEAELWWAKAKQRLRALGGAKRDGKEGDGRRRLRYTETVRDASPA
jgi:hypothetical protein